MFFSINSGMKGIYTITVKCCANTNYENMDTCVQSITLRGTLKCTAKEIGHYVKGNTIKIHTSYRYLLKTLKALHQSMQNIIK